MVETVGTKLQKARLAKGWSVDEVSSATKIRPERITDLESDDYSHFASLVYARSFLVKYARHLDVDIQEELDHFQVGRSVGLGELHYIAYAPPAPPKHDPHPEVYRVGLGLRIPPVVFALVGILFVIAVPAAVVLLVNLNRLNVPAADPSSSPNTVVQATPVATPEPSQAVVNVTPTPSATSASESDKLVVASPTQSDAPVEVRRALPVGSGDHAASDPVVQATPTPSAPATRQTLEIQVRERTWLRITRDSEKSAPIYDAFTGPKQSPIVVQGARFWIKVLNPDAVQIRKNGQLMSDFQNGVVIQ
jgi:cytoskeletal protein RodZ